jgi:hypothetical protein
MKPDRNQTAELPRSVDEIRAKLSLATEKWRESGVMLCELKKDIARFLVLKMTFEKGAGKSRKSRRVLSPEAAERLEKTGVAATPPPSTELRRIFVRVNHLMNLPVAKDRIAASALLLPSLNDQPCLTCGQPLPKGRKKFCSEECRKNQARGIRYSDAGTDSELPSEVTMHESEGEPSPEPGYGHRNMECDFYDACLDLAILEEWDGFHCAACELKGPQEQLVLGQDLP